MNKRSEGSAKNEGLKMREQQPRLFSTPVQVGEIRVSKARRCPLILVNRSRKHWYTSRKLQPFANIWRISWTEDSKMKEMGKENVSAYLKNGFEMGKLRMGNSLFYSKVSIFGFCLVVFHIPNRWDLVLTYRTSSDFSYCRFTADDCRNSESLIT